MSQLAEQVVRYDLDDLDVAWLQRVNEEREEIGNSLSHFVTKLSEFESHDKGLRNTIFLHSVCLRMWVELLGIELWTPWSKN